MKVRIYQRQKPIETEPFRSTINITHWLSLTVRSYNLQQRVEMRWSSKSKLLLRCFASSTNSQELGLHENKVFTRTIKLHIQVLQKLTKWHKPGSDTPEKHSWVGWLVGSLVLVIKNYQHCLWHPDRFSVFSFYANSCSCFTLAQLSSPAWWPLNWLVDCVGLISSITVRSSRPVKMVVLAYLAVIS